MEDFNRLDYNRGAVVSIYSRIHFYRLEHKTNVDERFTHILSSPYPYTILFLFYYTNGCSIENIKLNSNICKIKYFFVKSSHSLGV